MNPYKVPVSQTTDFILHPENCDQERDCLGKVMTPSLLLLEHLFQSSPIHTTLNSFVTQELQILGL